MRGPSPPEERLKELFERHADSIHRYVVRRLHGDDPADIVATTFLVACRRVESIPEGYELAWLYATARRVLQEHHREARGRLRLVSHLASQPEPAEVDRSDAAIDRILVHEALRSLSPADREALYLTEWEQLTAPEAAYVLGCTTAAFKVRLFRARRRFAQALPSPEAEHATWRPAVIPTPALAVVAHQGDQS